MDNPTRPNPSRLTYFGIALAATLGLAACAGAQPQAAPAAKPTEAMAKPTADAMMKPTEAMAKPTEAIKATLAKLGLSDDLAGLYTYASRPLRCGASKLAMRSRRTEWK